MSEIVKTESEALPETVVDSASSLAGQDRPALSSLVQMRATFEEACKLAWSIATAENLCRDGIDVTRQRLREELAAVGWSTETLAEEAKQRMHKRLRDGG